MARHLGEEKNEIILQDNLSNTEIGLFYRMPEADERLKYKNALHQRKGKKYVNRVMETRQKWGLEICTGVRTGDLTHTVDGKSVPLCTDANAENYVENWKSKVKKFAIDLMESLAFAVFENSVTLPEDADTAGDTDAGDDEDLGQD